MMPRWFEAGQVGALRRAALLPLGALSHCYAAGAALHRAWFEAGPGRQARLPCKVISVGNLVVGGSGKTPVAAWLAAALHGRGYRVALASRGHGGRGGPPVQVVSDGRRVLARAAQAGDEPLWLAAQTPGVPVLVGRRRDRVGRRAVADFGAEVLILDDGFQHHRLARDLNLLTFHGGAGLGNGRVLPRGPLRERITALRRADAILIVDGPLPPADAARIEAATADAAPGTAPPWFQVERHPATLHPLSGGAEEPPSSLSGRHVGILCAIARPAALRATLESLGAHITAQRCFPDHHRYSAQDLRGLSAQAPLWITTEKDAVKLSPAWLADADLRVLSLHTSLPEAERFLAWLETRLA